MRIILIYTALLLLSCGSKKEFAIQPDNKAAVNTGCPENGICVVKVNPNKELILKTTGSGELYYELQDSKDKTVIVYSYSKNVPKNIQDGTYREEIIFETSGKIQPSVTSDTALDQVKMLFGRFCYCKGSTGYYNVKKGNLKIDADKTKAVFSVSFAIDEVPQVLKKIDFTIQ